MKEIKKNQIYAIYWQDAAFSYEKTMPKQRPPIQVTFGVIISRNKNFINVGMNCHYDSKKGEITNIKDGFLIPIEAIIQMQEIGNIDDKK